MIHTAKIARMSKRRARIAVNRLQGDCGHGQPVFLPVPLVRDGERLHFVYKQCRKCGRQWMAWTDRPGEVYLQEPVTVATYVPPWQRMAAGIHYVEFKVVVGATPQNNP